MATAAPTPTPGNPGTMTLPNPLPLSTYAASLPQLIPIIPIQLGNLSAAAASLPQYTTSVSSPVSMSVTTPPIPTLQPSLSTSAAPTTPTNLSAPTTPVSNNFPHSYRSANIRTASYSGVRVYEIQCRGVPVMRRVADAYINATQILRAAGLPKPQRTKILERDVTGGVHEKVQGGYAGFQGTWIPLDSARMLARAHGVERDMDDLLSYQPRPGDDQVPPKEKRKRAPPKPKESTPVVKKERQTKPRKENDDSKEALGHASESEGEGDGESVAPDNVEESPETRRTTTMSLRPHGARTRRKHVYPGEDEDSSPSSRPSPKKRRTDSPAVTHAGSSSPPRPITPEAYPSLSPTRAPTFRRDNTPPYAGKCCEGCGVTSTPQWRRGPSGKRTLCNACGVKWSYGRLNPKGKRPVPALDEPFDDEFDLDDEEEFDSEAAEYLIADATSPLGCSTPPKSRDLEHQIRSLKRRLRDSEQSRKRLRRVLEEAATDDHEVDRSYRQILSKCAIAHPDHESESEEEWSNDAEMEHVVVERFLKAVKRNRARMDYHVGRMMFSSVWE